MRILVDKDQFTGKVNQLELKANSQHTCEKVLELANLAVHGPPPEPPAVMSFGELTELMKLAQSSTRGNNTKIQCIRRMREVYGLGLKEAKDFVEMHLHPFNVPESARDAFAGHG